MVGLMRGASCCKTRFKWTLHPCARLGTKVGRWRAGMRPLMEWVLSRREILVT